MEDTLCIEGKTYMASSSAAKKVGYTSDYVGQLCRGGKVDAMRVGRAWFVDVASLSAYITSGDVPVLRHTSVSEKEKLSQSASSESVPSDGTFRNHLPVFIESFFAVVVCGVLFVMGVQILSGRVPTTFPIVLNDVVAFTEYSISKDVSVTGTLSASMAQIRLGERIAYATYRGITDFVFGVRLAFAHMLYGTLSLIGFSSPDGTISEHVMVVVPAAVNKTDNEMMKEKIRQSFSDPVNVVVDEDGTGIITPIFKSGKDDEYMFVMVPVSR